MASDTAAGTNTLIGGLRRLYMHFSARRRWQLVIVIALMLVGAVAELATLGAVLPFLVLIADPGQASTYPTLQFVFGVLGWTNPDQILIPATLLFVAVAVIAAAVRLLLTWVSQKFVFRLGYDLGVEVYERSLYQPYTYHVSKNTSELIAGIEKVQVVIFNILLPLILGVIAAVISAFIFAALVAIDAAIALIAALGFGLMYLGITYATRWRLVANSTEISSAVTQRVKSVQEGMGGIRDILIDQSQQVYLSKFKRIESSLRGAQLVNVFIGMGPRFVIEACGMILIAGLALLLSTGEGGLIAAMPVLGALALGSQRLLPSVQVVYYSVSQIVGNQHALFDVLNILELPIHSKHLASNKIAPFPFEQEISLDGVCFGYGKERPLVLDRVSLNIEKGARVGFIGKTGGGKSTLMDLIMGLLEPTAGEIRVDGKVLTQSNMIAWQAQIAHVPQAIYLSDTTIAENIALGISPEEIDLKRVQDAAARAELTDFVETLPEKFETLVGERGIRLSGGQRQRIGIARALYKQVSVLVFDEATSALDNETEAAVMAAIQSLGRDLTILIIAHRLSTVARCDWVAMLEAGRIEAEGPPAFFDLSGSRESPSSSSTTKPHVP